LRPVVFPDRLENGEPDGDRFVSLLGVGGWMYISSFVHWILNAERALASLEETGEALNRMAEGNVGCWIFIS